MNIKAIATLLALPLLAACAPEIESTIYLADIQSAVEKGEPVTVPAVLRIPQSGEDDCKKGLSALVEKLKAIAPVTGEAKCISKDQHGQGTQLAEIGTRLQIVPAGMTVDQPNLFVIEAAAKDGQTALSFRMLKPIGDVIAALDAENPTDVDFDPSFFILHLNNDTAGTAQLSVGNVYADGKPVVPENAKPISLDRRGEVEIRFSDVGSSFVERGNDYNFATLLAR